MPKSVKIHILIFDCSRFDLPIVVRQGKWKLIYFYETGKKELYDIPADISEKHNLAERYPDVVKSLSANLGEFLRSSGAQRPSFKKTGKPCPWPDEI